MNDKNACYTVRRIRLLVMFGERCRTCGDTQDLEFAHQRRTDCVGMGRGYANRVRDVERRPEAYTLLCSRCHDLLDNRPVRKRQSEIIRDPVRLAHA